MTPANDDVDRALESIRHLEWDDEPHREALGREIERRARGEPRRGRARPALLAASIVLVLSGLALAAQGPLRRWISVWIESVSRDEGGEIESMTLRTEGGTRAQLVPLEASPDAFNPAIDEDAPRTQVSLRGGGTGTIRILRRGRRWHETFYKAVDGTSDPAPGARFTVETVNLKEMTAFRTEGVLEIRHTFEDGQVIDFVLRALPDRPGRYGDGETLVEWVAP